MVHQAQQYTPVILKLKILKQEDHGFKTHAPASYLLLRWNTRTQSYLRKKSILDLQFQSNNFHCGGEGVVPGAGS